jgi:hypothetical protein
MFTNNDKIKCDWCGQFISPAAAEGCVTNYIPETPISTETFEHRCEQCNT